MNSRLPGPTFFVSLMASALLTIWLGIAGPIDLSALKEWRTLISVIVAVAGIIFVLYSRKEDRIEKELPEVREATAENTRQQG